MKLPQQKIPSILAAAENFSGGGNGGNNRVQAIRKALNKGIIET